MKQPLSVEVFYHEYDCWTPCTQNGCPGHLTDIPIGIDIEGVSFYVDGYQLGDYPMSLHQEKIAKVKQVVTLILETLAGGGGDDGTSAL
jgi:hypothetical protein